MSILARACQTAPSRPRCRVVNSAFSENSDQRGFNHTHQMPLPLLHVSVDFHHEKLHIQMCLHTHDTDKQFHIIVTEQILRASVLKLIRLRSVQNALEGLPSSGYRLHNIPEASAHAAHITCYPGQLWWMQDFHLHDILHVCFCQDWLRKVGKN